jgi:hypothetical protein
MCFNYNVWVRNLVPHIFGRTHTENMVRSTQHGGGRTELHNKGLHNLYSSPNIISVMK